MLETVLTDNQHHFRWSLSLSGVTVMVLLHKQTNARSLPASHESHSATVTLHLSLNLRMSHTVAVTVN
jgi:hypothetical protein